jgi:hypothetical protein
MQFLFAQQRRDVERGERRNDGVLVLHEAHDELAGRGTTRYRLVDKRVPRVRAAAATNSGTGRRTATPWGTPRSLLNFA